MTASAPEDMDRLMADVHIARQLARPQPAPAQTLISAADLWADVRRAPGAPVSLGVARALRDNPKVAAQYRTMLEALAVAHSPVALAASDGEVERRLGDAHLRLLPPDTPDGVPLLILTTPAASATLEMIGPDGDVLRIALPPPDAGTVILALGPDVAEADRALGLLRDPGTAMYLLP